MKAVWANPDSVFNSEEYYQNRKAIFNGEDFRQGQSEAMRKRWADPDLVFHTEEHRQKRSEASKAVWVRGSHEGSHDTPEVRQKISSAMKAVRADPDSVFNTEEYHQKLSDAGKAMWADPDFFLNSEKHRQKMPERMRKAWADPSSGFNAEDFRQRQSEATKKAWARGDHDGVETRRKRSDARKAARASGVYDGVFQSPTSIELAVAAVLDICGIEHTSQYRPDGYSRIYDEFVSPNILIEVHGDYWHGPLRPENQKRDAEKAAWAKENGYHLVVMWEHEINERGAWALVHKKVLPLLNGELEGKKNV